MAKAEALYTWIRDHFAYNGVTSYTSANAGRKAYNDASGNVADINLSLVAAWRAAGLEAYPVLVSTRGHGIPHPVYPNYEDFNYVVGAVMLDDKVYFSDASNTGSLPFGILPVRCLNGNGWMAREEGGTWVNLKEKVRGAISLTSEFAIVDDNLVVKHQSKYDGYDALFERSQLVGDGEEQYQEKVMSYFADEVTEVQVKDEASSVKWSASCTSELDDPDLIYLKPVQAEVFLKNQFKREERQSPIDFAYQLSRRVIAYVTVPEGYEVVEMPKPAVIGLPDNGGRFVYSIQQNGNKITVSSSFFLSQLDFGSIDYPYLKQYFQMAVDKNNEMIVLKKI
ncbi:MAG: transglutaminase domain-containing protein [Bacteroidota bacterium]